ncbi:hypothetical protein [Cronobacter dublinensis]|uniref:hypothetical protein n=1 Tax=Cronobacter dublinensis TaxID=413497 RepID=UPI000CFD4FB9|nr:hypothetical protein [Cronobacter dublinensis]
MKRKAATSILYAPLLLMFFGVPLIHDLIPNSAVYKGEDWLAFLLIYVVGFIFASPLFYLIFKVEAKTVELTKRAAICFGFCILIITFVVITCWNKTGILYVGLALTMLASYLVMYFGRTDLTVRKLIVRDKDTGAMYKVERGHMSQMTPNEIADFNARALSRSVNLVEISPSKMEGLDTFTAFTADNGHPVSLYLNPANGLPMIGGTSGLDINGNTWGTNFNDPSAYHSSFDPHRGY